MISNGTNGHTTNGSNGHTSGPRTSFKRLILLCDGTWNSVYNKDGTNEATNVAKMGRAIMAEDRSTSTSVDQIVFYQTGLGTSGDWSADISAGVTGLGIIEKIKEAYVFLVNNWLPGDEIFLFGFSRGAYTARMIGALVGDVGILEKTSMSSFYDLFRAYQALGDEDPTPRAEAEKYLANYRPGGAKAARSIPDGTLKCIGVWDTVGALGIPAEAKATLTYKTVTLLKKTVGHLWHNGEDSKNATRKTFLGFVDTQLGKHVKYAFHALAINETRKDFLPTKWQQPVEHRRSGQLLKQVWFSGAHSDVGGGYAEHDLSDLALVWMLANLIEYDLLAINKPYVLSLPAPEFPWGEMKPHDPTQSGLMAFSKNIVRKTPQTFNEDTQEKFHSSVTARSDLTSDMKNVLSTKPELIEKLLPLELEIKSRWVVASKH